MIISYMEYLSMYWGQQSLMLDNESINIYGELEYHDEDVGAAFRWHLGAE